jgi:hypothetical protein
MSESIHEWDGAYVLGALSPDDRRRYEAHLAECSSCAQAVQDLAGLPGLLGRLDHDEALALRDLPDDDALRDGAHAPDRAAGVARRVRRRRSRVRLLTAGVLVAVLGVGSLAGWSIVRAVQPAAQVVAATHELKPLAGSHLTADLTVTPVGWGTRLDWSCDYRAPAGEGEEEGYAPTSYSLVVTTDAGRTATVATWTSDAGEAKGLVAATAIPADTIASVDIRRTGTSTPLAETRF